MPAHVKDKAIKFESRFSLHFLKELEEMLGLGLVLGHTNKDSLSWKMTESGGA